MMMHFTEIIELPSTICSASCSVQGIQTIVADRIATMAGKESDSERTGVKKVTSMAARY